MRIPLPPCARLVSLTILHLLLLPTLFLHAQTDSGLMTEVDTLVHNHYMNGIDYARARALGPDAIPYLVGQLNDPTQKEFWVNIIVTLGFIEDPQAILPLRQFLEGTEGEVDVATFRALLSVPYAIGCIASSGDREAFSYLEIWIDSPDTPPAAWSFQNKNIRQLLSEYALMGIAVSGRAEARTKLEQLQKQQDEEKDKGLLRTEEKGRHNNLETAFSILAGIKEKGRARILNPQTNR